MVRRLPPDDCPSDAGPIRLHLPPGKVLLRVHSERFGADSFNLTVITAKREPGRFDSADGDYGVLYAADGERTAMAEAFLRGEPVSGPTRILPRRRLAGVLLSEVMVRQQLSLVSLIGGAALGRVGQDAWLTSCDEDDFDVTRQYAKAIRRWAPWAQGLAWHSKRDNTGRSLVLFSDRLDAGDLEAGASRRLDDPLDPFAKVLLARLSVALEDPVP